MNNNEILSSLQTNGEEFEPSNRLSPSSIEDSLQGVKRRKSRKGIVTSCIAVGLAVLTAATMFSVNLYRRYEQPKLPVSVQTKVKSYDDIYGIVNQVKKAANSRNALFAEYEMGVSDTVKSTSTAVGSSNVGNTYSDTNIQVDGVDEGDKVKTDGKYIYSIGADAIRIIDPNAENDKTISKIEAQTNDNCVFNEMYVHGDKLIVTARVYDYDVYDYDSDDTNEATPDSEGVTCYGEIPLNTETVVYIYDISDVKSPKLASTLSQSGDMLSTRKIGDIIYLVTSYVVYNYDSIEKDKPETYCPYYTANGKISCVDAGSIEVFDRVNNIEYVTVSSIDLNNVSDFSCISSALGAGSDIYASKNNIYTSGYFYGSNEDKGETQFMRFSIDGAKITQSGKFTVSGNILNQFSMDEYNGYFRVVTLTDDYDYTSREIGGVDKSHTNLYVFDESLTLVGKTQDAGIGEQIESVRFDGDIAYFVTFRRTDPLYAVDISDPKSPKILSELKIPGFSEYLHVVSDNMLLGFGRNADEDGIENGFKLTMFDISDKKNITELSSVVFAGAEFYSQAEYDHKAVFIDENKRIVAVPYNVYHDNGETHFYTVYSYDDSGNFTRILNQETGYTDYSADTLWSFDCGRGLYIGSKFYIVTPQKLFTYDYNTFKLIDESKI